MAYLKYEKKYIEVTDKQANYFANLIDKNQKIPLGMERLNPKKCEIVLDLPTQWDEDKAKDWEVVFMDRNLQLDTGDIQKNKFEETERMMKDFIAKTPEHKAEQFTKNVATMFYKIRNGFGKVPNPKRIELIHERILEFYKVDTDKYFCPLEVYQDLLPPVTRNNPRNTQRDFVKI